MSFMQQAIVLLFTSGLDDLVIKILGSHQHIPEEVGLGFVCATSTKKYRGKVWAGDGLLHKRKSSVASDLLLCFCFTASFLVGPIVFRYQKRVVGLQSSRCYVITKNLTTGNATLSTRLQQPFNFNTYASTKIIMPARKIKVEVSATMKRIRNNAAVPPTPCPAKDCHWTSIAEDRHRAVLRFA